MNTFFIQQCRVICFITCASLFQMNAQVRKGFELLKKRDFPAARIAFERDLSHPDRNAFARYGLALMAMQGKNAKNIDSLMAADVALATLEAEGWATNLHDEPLRKKWGIPRKAPTLKRQAILERIIQQLTETNDLGIYDELMEKYPNWLKINTEHFKDIRYTIVQKLFQNAQDYKTLTGLYRKHQDVLRINNLILDDIYEKKILDIFLKEHGLLHLPVFVKDYPEHFVSLDCFVDELVTHIQRDSVLGGLHFLDKYPLSVLDFLAVNYSYERSTLVNQWAKGETRRRWNHLLEESRLWKEIKTLPLKENILNQFLLWIDAGYSNPFVYYRVMAVADWLHQQQAYQEVLRVLQRAKLLFPDVMPDNCHAQFLYYHNKQKKFKNALDLLSKPTRDLHKKPLNVVNTQDHHESSPVVTADGRELYFARAGGRLVDSEDIYMCHKLMDGSWSLPQKVPNLSDKGNEAPLSITADGLLMLVAVNGRLHFSTRTAEGWSKAVYLSQIHQYYPWVGKATLSSDGKVLLFEAGHQTSKTDAEVRSIALYASIRNIDGTWREPFSLGVDINRWGYQSRSPFLSLDDQTLYFSSNAFEALGETDILVTRRLDDTWKRWSPPINLGKEINSFSDDWGFNFSVTASSRSAFTGSKQETYNIFQISLPEEVRPLPRTAVVGKGDMRAAGSKISFRDAQTGVLVAETTVRPDGTYSVLLPPGKIYTKSLENAGTLAIPGLLDLRDNHPELNEDAVETVVPMVFVNDLLEKQQAIPVDILFEKNQTHFIDESYSILNQLADLFKKQLFEIEIIGHTDNTGKPEHNRQLSKERADAIKYYLESKGVPTQQMSTDGKGADYPIQSNDTEAGRKANRRVEIRLKSKLK